MQNRRYIILVALFGIILASVGLYGVNALQNASVFSTRDVVAREPRTLYVTGSGLASAEPNLAKVSLGVYTEAPNANDAVKQNAVKMNRVIDALRVSGISNESLETRYYTLSSVIDYNAKPPQVVGYRVSNVITVSVYELTTVGQVIDAAVKAGANEVQGIAFILTEDQAQELKLTALKNAGEDAQTKASTLAASLGVEIVGILKIVEGSTYYPLYRTEVKDIQNAYTPIIPGDVQISATIQVTYLIH
jgi:hypothetical protein